MKIAFRAVLLALTMGLLLGAQAPPDDEGLEADVTDTQGVTTHVRGLHYCYEEESGEEVYITKYDSLFVERGDAVISVRLDSLASLEFTGKTRDEKEKKLFEARIITLSKVETTAFVICHSGGFIKAEVDLGEFELPLERVKKIVFAPPGRPSSPSLRCFLPENSDEAGLDGAVCVFRLGKDGGLGRKDTGTDRPGAAAAPVRVRLETAAGVTYPVFREALARLARQGVAEVILPGRKRTPSGKR